MEKKYLDLVDNKAYRIAFDLSNYIFAKLDELPKEVHSLIKFTNEKLKE